MQRTRPQTNVEPGAFPFPITDGPDESRYLTWVRNHSNYMAERGLLDYLRLIAVLVRGILINFLTLLPYILSAALAFSLVYNTLLDDWDAQVPREDRKLFITKQATRPGWVMSLQDALFSKHANAGTVAGTWQAGDTLETTFTPGSIDQGEPPPEPIIARTTVPPGETTAEQVRDLHLADLDAETAFRADVDWTTSGTDRITVVSGEPFDVSAVATSAAGTLAYDVTVKSVSTPFLVTPLVLALAVLWILLFPVVSRLYKVAGYKKTLETGSSSSVKKRDLFERSFGGFLLLLLGVAGIEALPLVVHFFHRFPGWEVGFPTAAAAVGVLIVANKLLPLLGGLLKKLAITLVAALGVLVPLLVVLVVVEFIVYPVPSSAHLDAALLLLPPAIALAIIIAMVLGIRSFKGRGFGKLLLLLVCVIGLFALVVTLLVLSKITTDYGNFFYVLAWTIEIWVFCWLAVDVNLTSINGLYRDRLASAFLVGTDTEGDVDIEQDVDLQEIGHYDAGSTAPYHLVNVTLNLQGSKDISIRERNSDFFIFSKRFVGGDRTGYCRSEDLEQVYPQVDLGTAMAISAAAASPNMGRGTNPLFVAFLTLLNVRLGFWIPNPGLLSESLAGESVRRIRRQARTKQQAPGHRFADVFEQELLDIERRRSNVDRAHAEAGDPPPAPRPLHRTAQDELVTTPAVAHGLVGIGFSGGGIRSATINMGIAQALHQRGVFDHIDYMSTVSGGGYLGSSISTLMRYRTKPVSEIAGTVSIDSAPDEKIVRVRGAGDEGDRTYRYADYAEFDDGIRAGEGVTAGQRILRRRTGCGGGSLMDSFKWRVRPNALLHEMMSRLDETHNWVNLSDGGHIENLAGIELLRRRCKFIILGDGEADPRLHFNGLATLIRYARIDLGIRIDIVLDQLRLAGGESGIDRRSHDHFAVGRIKYPGESEPGHLLYLKSSFTGDEDEVIAEYRHRSPTFPHESTADQAFDEGQFEAYRALGQHIGERALARAPGDGTLPFADLEKWFAALGTTEKPKAASTGKKP